MDHLVVGVGVVVHGCGSPLLDVVLKDAGLCPALSTTLPRIDPVMRSRGGIRRVSMATVSFRAVSERFVCVGQLRANVISCTAGRSHLHDGYLDPPPRTGATYCTLRIFSLSLSDRGRGRRGAL